MNRKLATTAIGCLQSPPDENAATRLSRLNERESRVLLKWLDEGGVSLYLLAHLRTFGAETKLSHSLQDELSSRLHANQIRTQALFEEFARVNSILQASGASFTFMKGFTLTPSFCSSIYLRHQTDIDVHISPLSVACARHALIQSGYVLELEHPSGELRFVSSLHESRKQSHAIYGVPSFSRVEFHQKLWEERELISLQPPEQCFWGRAERSLMGIQYPGFSTLAMLILQLLHAFRHLLSSWIRQSWLYEICYFLNHNRADDGLWEKFVELVSEDQPTSEACAIVLALCSHVFKVQLPDIVDEGFVSKLPQPIREWVRLCGERFALSDAPGTKLDRMIHLYFLTEASAGKARRRPSLLPSAKTLSTVTRNQLRDPERTPTSISQFLMKRLWFHTSASLEYLWYSYNWRRTITGQ